MGRRKTSNRGRKPKEEKDCTYNNLDAKDNRTYHNKALRKHRGHTEEDEAPTSSKKLKTSTPSSRTRGRPPIMGLVAMSPYTLNGRKRYLMSSRRKKERRTKKGKVAMKLRFSSPSESEAESADERSSSSDEEETVGQPDDVSTADTTTTTTTPTTATTTTTTTTSTDKSSKSTSKDAVQKATWRARCVLRGVLTNDLIDNLKLLLLFNNIHSFPVEFSNELSKLNPIMLMEGQKKYSYRIKRLSTLFGSLEPTVQTNLLQSWIKEVLSSRVVQSLLIGVDVNLPENCLPRVLVIRRHSADIVQKYVGVSSKLPRDIRQNGINYVIDVAKTNKLAVSDASILSSVTNCGLRFARKVLHAIDENKEAELLTLRKERFDSISVSEWPAKISEFVLRPENSRATPGQESVSVSYGTRKPKYLLLHSRDKIASNFKAAYPNCQYSVSTIKREFPPNAVTPTSRDSERNTCPTHANIRRLVNSINNVFRKNNVNLIPYSCRELCTQFMCTSDTVSSEEPVSWTQSCLNSICKELSTFGHSISYFTWGERS